jgi:DNA replication protein DnaC
LIEYVFMPANVDPAFENMLMAWSQDGTIFDKNSTAMLLCSDLSLFNETVRRLSFTYTIEPSTPEERRKILEDISTDLKKGFKKQVAVTEDMVQQSSGLTLHDTETAALEGFTTSPEREFQIATFTEYKKKILKEAGLDFVQPKTDFSHIGGYRILKQYMRNRVIAPLRDPEKANYYGVGLPKGMILVGLPGTGKTVLADALAKELGLAMIKLSASDFFRGIVGESESRVKRLTTIIESLAPVVVMIDEVDALAMKRGAVMQTDSGVQRRITNMLLEWLGQRDRRSFLIGATNFIEQMDPAFVRPGNTFPAGSVG